MSGITNCWLSNTWKQFWSSSFNYNSIFEYLDNMIGKILYLKLDGAIVRPDLQLPVAEMIGHLIYLMTVLDIEVTRPFTFATLLMLCNQVPASIDLSFGVDPTTRNALERDFHLGWGATWSMLTPMRTNFQFVANLVTVLANNQLDDQLGWTFKNFKLQEAWKQVEDKLGAIIYSHLFNGRLEIGKAMRRGFYLAIDAAKTSNVKLQSMKTALDNLIADSLQVVFSGKNAMEAADFLNKCTFTSKVPQQLANMFKACVHQMIYGERARLAVFITGNKYFGGKQ